MDDQVSFVELSIDGAYDRPSTYISDLLCFYYDRCRSPLTGPGTGGAKRLVRASAEGSPSTCCSLTIHPNPASEWIVCEVDLDEDDATGVLSVTDALGRTVLTKAVSGTRSSTVLDLQGLQAGLYTIELRANDRTTAHTSFVKQ